MALVTLAISWKQGDQPLNPGGTVTIPANYANLGSYAKWNRRYLTGIAPYSPDPRLPAYNSVAPVAWNNRSSNAIGQLDQSVANVNGIVNFAPASPSGNLATDAAAAAQTSNANATKTLL
jgi:hypothetical protein